MPEVAVAPAIVGRDVRGIADRRAVLLAPAPGGGDTVRGAELYAAVEALHDTDIDAVIAARAIRREQVDGRKARIGPIRIPLVDRPSVGERSDGRPKIHVMRVYAVARGEEAVLDADGEVAPQLAFDLKVRLMREHDAEIGREAGNRRLAGKHRLRRREEVGELRRGRVGARNDVVEQPPAVDLRGVERETEARRIEVEPVSAAN